MWCQNQQSPPDQVMKLQLFPLWDLFTGSWQGANSARIVQSRPCQASRGTLVWKHLHDWHFAQSPRHWSLTAYDITKDTPDRCLHGILQHFKRELVVLIMVVVWKGTMQAPRETFDQPLLLAQCHGTVTAPGKGPFLAEGRQAPSPPPSLVSISIQGLYSA